MKIAYVITESYALSKFNGIRVQADVWADELIKKGHNVIRVNPWEKHEWSEYDVVHIFGPCEFLLALTKGLKNYNTHIVFSPIIDTIQSIPKYKFASYWGSKKLRLTSQNYMIRQSSPYIDFWLARSNYELKYINEAYSIPKEKIAVIPLSFRIPLCESYPAKEKVCLHVSKITDGRKNVMRLIDAAIKYQFKLILAGSIGSEEEYAPFKKKIEENENITYLGRVSDDELIRLYSKAKVFALPSINEGVGMVAVEAASYGCDIVITEIGGPKEYYGGSAFVVNPYSVDEIGRAVVEAMETNKYQPALMKEIQCKYNLDHCVEMMVDAYKHIID